MTASSVHKTMTRVPALVALLLLVLTTAPAAIAQETKAPTAEPNSAQVQLVGIEVTPSDPSTDALCQLKVLIENSAERPVFSLAFEVEVGGQGLAVYEKQLFMVPVEPMVRADDNTGDNTGDKGHGEPFELDLFNFWTSDSRRPAPANGKLPVTVRLVEAQWLEITQEEDASGAKIDVWTPHGAVPGLPSEVSTILELKKP